MHEIQSKIVKLAIKEDISALGYRKLGQKIGSNEASVYRYFESKNKL